ncbi:MAG: hypothetical protein ACK5OB_19440 [Pirellula sp.]
MPMRRLVLFVLFGVASTHSPAMAQNSKAEDVKQVPSDSDYRVQKCEGWTLHVHRGLEDKDAQATSLALELLENQLQEIAKVVPEPALKHLREVELWVSPEYPNIQPRAEYHPSVSWLRENHRNPAMEKGIEFTNVRIFEAETRRMPNFALHELAHAYHDRVLERGFQNPKVLEAYQRAKASGTYDRVEQRFGDGRSATTRAYAMQSQQEYFAEASEAFFSTNDFFPFTRAELEAHDPKMVALLSELWEAK